MLRCHIDTIYVSENGRATTSWRSYPYDLAECINKTLEDDSMDGRTILEVAFSPRENDY